VGKLGKVRIRTAPTELAQNRPLPPPAFGSDDDKWDRMSLKPSVQTGILTADAIDDATLTSTTSTVHYTSRESYKALACVSSSTGSRGSGSVGRAGSVASHAHWGRTVFCKAVFMLFGK